MWFDRNGRQPDWRDAERHLARVDPRLAAIIERVGPCTLRPRRDYFVVLCKAIFTQQISTTVAATLFGRFRDLFPRRRPTPGLTLKLLTGGGKDAVLRACGLSRQKASYLLDLAQHFHEGQIPTSRLSRMSDEDVIDVLVHVRGIGRWTAEMFLIFVLNRSDVLPVDDLGLREGLREIDDLPQRLTPSQVIARGESWRPYRSIATWYVWRRNSAAPPSTAERSRSSRSKVSRQIRR